MTKPVINSFSAIAPLIIHQYEGYLPTAFDESMSLVEKVNKVIQRLNELGEITKDIVEQWNSVMEWVMSDGLTEAVNGKLDEMAVDGTLEQIINDKIFSELNDKIDSLFTIPRKRIETEINDNARIQEALDSLNGNGTLKLNAGETYELTGITISGNIEIIGNNAYFKSVSLANTTPIIKNKVGEGAMLIVEGVRFTGSNRALELRLDGSNPNSGLHLSMKNCRFDGINRNSDAIYLRQIDFVELAKIHVRNYNTFLTIESNYNVGERDNTQIHIENIAVLDTNLGGRFRQMDKATIKGFDVNGCGAGFYFEGDNKRTRIVNCHVEKYGKSGYNADVGNGYAYYFPENKFQTDLMLDHCTSLLPVDGALGGLYLGDSDSLLTNVIIENCYFANNVNLSNHKSCYLYGNYTWKGRFPYTNDVVTWKSLSTKINGFIHDTGWELPKSKNVLPFNAVTDPSQFTGTVGSGTLAVTTGSNEYYDEYNLLTFTTSTGVNLQKYVTKQLKQGWYTLLFSGYRTEANPFIMIQQLVSPYSNALRVLPTNVPNLMTRIPFYVPATATYKIGFSCNENSKLILSQMELVKGFGHNFNH